MDTQQENDNNAAAAGVNPNQGTVMDVVPPQAAAVESATSESVQPLINEPAAATETSTPDSQGTVETPVQEAPPEEVTESSTPSSEATGETASADNNAETTTGTTPVPNNTESESSPSSDTAVQPTEPVVVPKKEHNAPVGVITVAVVVAASLCVLAGFAVKKASQPTARVAPISATAPGATVKDVDETNKSIDDGLKSVDDSADFSNSDLTDATLGL